MTKTIPTWAIAIVAGCVAVFAPLPGPWKLILGILALTTGAASLLAAIKRDKK
ncbi:hypothetical protein QP400_06630 [Winkia sp. UMB3158]|jgi:hypothetical protein|uniref:Uncharacterized protein n=1 Tax=Winkia neuii subsp. anitrata TaxID=29318 RepID=A0AB38XQ05_9ACTO|nr:MULTISPECIES: hypothetical protein [Winkia]MDK6241344.1 hypothetical protein [Winkia sp. UMB10116]MDK7149800.1 hypothetical protein [Winkia sp. UMB3158]MDK7163521.1 hypothetical protein [Winkia sp. UMB3105]MDK7229669.1 hypothetical protein [Winkia sp. UMB1185]MDK8100704.1 hypothetical protein [Winkia neuii]